MTTPMNYGAPPGMHQGQAMPAQQQMQGQPHTPQATSACGRCRQPMAPSSNDPRFCGWDPRQGLRRLQASGTKNAIGSDVGEMVAGPIGAAYVMSQQNNKAVDHQPPNPELTARSNPLLCSGA
mmetsp:Transcript_18036/g.27959  ORF Transcript_18036/g.27959 Transcript_18036/m.27959 type:complete len:123 (-) Transcript_18036:667-1035(-)